MRPFTPFRLITLHAALCGLSTAMAGGFVGAYLMLQGLSLAAALATYALLLVLRFGLRVLALEVVRRVGMAGALKLGAALGAAAFGPLLLAADPRWLGVWVLVIALSEAIYWPVFHAATAATAAGPGMLGRQVGERTMVGAVVSVIGPLLGGSLLSVFGEAAGFGIAGVVCLASILPLTRLGHIEAGPVPRLRDTLRGIDRVGVAAFAADGWIAAGIGYAWPMVLFTSMDGSYQAFGAANAAAGLAGAATGLLCGRAIDRGQRGRILRVVSVTLGVGILLRATSAWSPLAATVATVTGAAIAGCYGPVLYSAIYGRARRSGAAYRFHLAAEAGWDCGAVAGLLVAALVAATTTAPSLAVLPALLGVAAQYLCLREASVDAAGTERLATAAG